MPNSTLIYIILYQPELLSHSQHSLPSVPQGPWRHRCFQLRSIVVRPLATMQILRIKLRFPFWPFWHGSRTSTSKQKANLLRLWLCASPSMVNASLLQRSCCLGSLVESPFQAPHAKPPSGSMPMEARHSSPFVLLSSAFKPAFLASHPHSFFLASFGLPESWLCSLFPIEADENEFRFPLDFEESKTGPPDRNAFGCSRRRLRTIEVRRRKTC